MTPPDESPRITPDIPGVPRLDQEEKPKQRTPALKKLERQLTELYETLAVIVVTPFDRLGGMLMHSHAGDLSAAWIDLAERDARVKATLERILEATGWGGVLAAHAVIVVPVLANRGYLPDGIANGAATLTMMQNPETAPLFTHARWSQADPNMNGQSGESRTD